MPDETPSADKKPWRRPEVTVLPVENTNENAQSGSDGGGTWTHS